MRFLPLAISGLLLGTALPALAQTPAAMPAPVTPRYYVGLGAYSSFYQPLGRQTSVFGSGSGSRRLPVQLTMGYQLRPRLAVQVGLAYSEATVRYAYAGRVYGNGPGGYVDYQSNTTSRGFSASVLGRYTLTRNAAHRLQFDALGGFAVEHTSHFDRGTQADSLGGTAQLQSFARHSTDFNLLVTGGISARYRLSPRFDLALDVLLSHSLLGPTIHQGPLGLASSQALGLRYRFGKP